MKGLIAPLAYYISQKTQSLEAMLPTIKFNHAVFHVALLEQDTTRKGRVYKNATRTITILRERCYSATDKNITEFEFKASNNKEYEVDGIRDSAIYAKKSEAGHLPGLGISVAASTLPPLLGSGDDKKKLIGLQYLNLHV